MQTIINNAHELKLNNIQLFYEPSDVLFFDIETTGFTAEKTFVYLIGCSYFDENTWKIIQWFNDDGNSEREIIESFLEFSKKYKYILNYNGDGFDIPYINKKIEMLGLEYDFDKLCSIDLYKNVRPYKKVLHFDNLKQKTLEKFLGINRLDKYSGGDLIKVYNDFIKNNDESRKKLLLQHNYEDIEGLLACFSMLSYQKLKAGCINVTKLAVVDKKLVFSLSLEYPLPKRITTGIGDIVLTANRYEGSITAPIISDTLHFFFEDYKDYYYLPAEDMAVHKSVARYVDKDYRERAKKENCYVKKDGHFISQVNAGIVAGYKRKYDDKESFIELADSFLKEHDMLVAYARHVIECSLK